MFPLSRGVHACLLSRFSPVQPFVVLWAIARQAALSMGFSKNTGVGSHAFLQELFLTQGSSPCLLGLLRWQAGSLPPVPPGKPLFKKGAWQRC